MEVANVVAALETCSPAADISELPAEALVHVLGMVSYHSSACAAQTCRTMRAAFEDLPTVLILQHTKTAAMPKHTGGRSGPRFWQPAPQGREPQNPACIGWLESLRSRRQLLELRVSSPWLHDGSINRLISEVLIQHPGLRHLTLIGPRVVGSQPRIGPDGTEELARWLRGTSGHLVSFSLCNSRMGVTGALALAEAIEEGGPSIDDLNAEHSGLHTLRLRRCGLLKADIRPIATAIARGRMARSLTDVSFAHNRMGKVGASALARWLAYPHCQLRRLDLSACELNSTAVAELTAVLSLPVLAVPNADGHAVSSRRCASSLRVLLLACNVFGRLGARELAALLISRCSTIERLDVSRNGLGEFGLLMLASAMEKVSASESLPSLKEVVLWPTRDPRRICEPELPEDAALEWAALEADCKHDGGTLDVWPLRLGTLAKCRQAALALWRRHQT